MAWKLVIGEQIGTWGCKGRMFYGGRTYNVDDPEIVSAAASVRHISVLPGDADIEAWKLEQAVAAAPAPPEAPEPEEDFVANTGEVTGTGDEDPPAGESESEGPPAGENESEDPAAEAGGEMDMRSELEAALEGDGGSESPAETPTETAKKPPRTRRQRRPAG